MLKESFCKLTSTSGLFAYRRAIISERERRRRRIRLAGIFVSVPVRTMWAHSRLLTQKLPPRNSRQQLKTSLGFYSSHFTAIFILRQSPPPPSWIYIWYHTPHLISDWRPAAFLLSTVPPSLSCHILSILCLWLIVLSKWTQRNLIWKVCLIVHHPAILGPLDLKTIQCSVRVSCSVLLLLRKLFSSFLPVVMFCVLMTAWLSLSLHACQSHQSDHPLFLFHALQFAHWTFLYICCFVFLGV